MNDDIPITRSWDVGPVGLIMWSWPKTWALSLRVWKWKLEYHPLTRHWSKVYPKRSGLMVGRHWLYVKRWTP